MQNRTEVHRITLPWGRSEAFLVVFLTWAAIYLPGLGTPELRGEEGRRILPAVTMLRTGDWLVPRVGGAPYYRKPPFINWLVAGSFALTGQQNELSARLPSVLFLLAFITLLIWLPGDWLRVEARLIATILLLTTIGVIDKGRQIEIEAVYLSLTSMAILIWLSLWARGGSRWTLWLVPSLFVAAGLLTKGPPILIFYYIPIVYILVHAHRRRELLSLPHLVGILLCLGLPALWAYAAVQAATAGHAVTGLSSETIARLSPSALDWPQWASHVVASFANLLPWVLFTPLLWRRDFVDSISRTHLSLFQGARLGLVLAFLAITLIPGNGGRYGLPAAGLESILLGWVLAEVGELPDTGRLWRRSAIAGYLLAIAAAAVGLISLRRDIGSAVLLWGTVWLTVVLVRRRGVFRTPVPLALLSAALAAVLMLQYVLFVPPLMQRQEKHRPAAALVNALVPNQEPLYIYKPDYQDFLFYLRAPVEYLVEPAQVDGRLHFLLVRESAYQQLKDEPALAAHPGKTLCRFTYWTHGDFRLLELLTETP